LTGPGGLKTISPLDRKEISLTKLQFRLAFLALLTASLFTIRHGYAQG